MGAILLERGEGPCRIARDRPSRYGVTGWIAISIPFFLSESGFTRFSGCGFCRAGAPAPAPTSVVPDRLIWNGSGAGAPELQRGMLQRP